MLITEKVDAQLAAARAFAERAGLSSNLEERLRYLDLYASPARNSRCTLYHDHAPYSFAFVLEVQDSDGRWRTWFEGGLLYHGPHDGGGSGCYPTLAVLLTPTVGWAIHT